MAQVAISTGFRVYRDYSQRKGYNQDHLRRARNQYVVEALFGSNNKTVPSSKTRRLRKNLKALQKISDTFFKRVKLDPQVLEAFKNVLGPSFEYGTIDHESFLSSQKSNHFLLLKLLFETLSQNYDRILELENQVQSLTDENSNLNSYLLDVQDEMEKLRKYASDCNEMRVSEVGVLSEEYQMLYDDHSNVQEELNNTLQKNYYLERKIDNLSSRSGSSGNLGNLVNPRNLGNSENVGNLRNVRSSGNVRNLGDLGSSGHLGSSGLTRPSGTSGKKGGDGEYGFEVEHEQQSHTKFQLATENMELFEPIIDDNVDYQSKIQEYEKKIKELKLSNDRLFEEKAMLTRATQESFGSDKFVTLSLLFHQITKTFNKVFQDQNEVKKVTMDSENTEKLRKMLLDSRINTLEYENRAYKQRLTEVEDALKDETVEKFSLDSEISHLKMDLYSSQEVYLKLENLNSSLLRSENELNLMRTNRDVYVEQLGKMQHLVTNLTRDKNELTATVSKMEFSKETLVRELDVHKEQLKTMENLFMEQGSKQFDFKDKITNIQLQANTKILEDKLGRIKRQLDETRLENSNLVTNMVELRNTLERVRRENSELGKTVAASLDNESRFTLDIQRLVDEVNSLKASLNRNAMNFKAMSNEMSQMSKRLFEKNLQLSALESKKDKVVLLLNEFTNKLSCSRVVTVNVEEVKNMDLKSLNYSELIHFLTGTNNASNNRMTNTGASHKDPMINDDFDASRPSELIVEGAEEEVIHNLTNLVNFNEFMVVLCINLARELNSLTGNVLNVTNFSNIFETFKVEVINPDMMKNQYLSEISDLELKLKNLEKLNGELGSKHAWEKSVMRMRDKYEKSLSSHKDVLRECRKLLRVNDKNLEILRQDNTRLASENSASSNLLSDTEAKLTDSMNELVHLKDLIYSLVPNELKFNASKDAPLKSIEILSNYLNTLSTAFNTNQYSLYVSTLGNQNANDQFNDGRNGMFMSAGSKNSQELALVNQQNGQNGQNVGGYGHGGYGSSGSYGNNGQNGNNRFNGNGNYGGSGLNGNENNGLNGTNANYGTGSGTNNNNNNNGLEGNNNRFGYESQLQQQNDMNMNGDVNNGNYGNTSATSNNNNNMSSNMNFNVGSSSSNYNNNTSSNTSANINAQNLLAISEAKKELSEKVELLKYKDQLLDDVYDNVSYYCNLMLTDIKSQLGSEQVDTDYESTKSNREVQSDDTISDYRDEDYVVEKFEEVLNLLNKLFCQYNYSSPGSYGGSVKSGNGQNVGGYGHGGYGSSGMNGQNGNNRFNGNNGNYSNYGNNSNNLSYSNNGSYGMSDNNLGFNGSNLFNFNKNNNNRDMGYEAHFDNRNYSNLVLDMNVIKSINKFVGTLKNYYNKINSHNTLLLDDLEYDFESIPTIIDQGSKFRVFCSNLTKLLNLAGGFIYNQLNENSENMEQLLKKLEDNKGVLHELEQMNMAKDQQLMSNQYEINELRLQLDRLQELYDREKNNNREANFNLEKYEYELTRLRSDLSELSEKNHKLQLIVKEYEEVVQLLRQ